MDARLPIGFSDFAQLRQAGLTYVDKTALVSDVVRAQRQAVLLARPRRFGKTLNLTMLRAFFEKTEADPRPLFEGLAVASEGPDVLEHLGRHPVIYLTMKDVKERDWATCLERLGGLVADEVARHERIWGVETLSSYTRGRLEVLRSGRASEAELSAALSRLSAALHTATGEQTVLLIDEYDTPVHAGYVHGYYDQIVGFFRNFLSAGLKDNPHLYRGVITGILRVAKESIFSGLNNVSVHTALSAAYADRFGFTDAEVDALCALTGAEGAREDIRAWYDGYTMGTARIYNPWSVLSYLANPEDGLKPHWVNTASDDILRELLIGVGLGVHDDLSALIRGESIQRPISEEIVLREVRRDPDALWSFLLFSGYLTAERPLSRSPDGLPDSPLRIPNHEVSVVYRHIFQSWLRTGLRAGSDAPMKLARALLDGDEETLRALLARLIRESLSYHDTAGRHPEPVYQAFIVGLLVQLEDSHDVRSNRESGYGRYDVLVRPKTPGRPGAVLELKVIDTDEDESAETALDRAMTQVRERDYTSELRSAGADPIWRWGAVFDGKRAWVRVERDER